MSELSAVEIAQRQRYLYLLQKVKENKPLSTTELKELKKYEAQMAAQKKQKITLPSITVHKQRKKKVTKNIRHKGKRCKRHRLPISAARVKILAFECANLTEADSVLQKADDRRIELKTILKKYPKLQAAWVRGQFLRNLRLIAQTPITVSEAAKKLELENGKELREILDSDIEASDIWQQTRLDIFVEAKTAILEATKAGNQAAIKVIDNLLREENVTESASIERLTTKQLCELVGRTRVTIHEWQVKFGLPRNSDKTFDLHDFLPWFEDFIIKKLSHGKETTGMDAWKSLRTEKLQLEIATHKHQLLDRTEVMAGILARHQIFITWSGQKAEELGRLCQGQKPERIAQIFRDSIMGLRKELCNVPAELQLAPDAAKMFQKLLESIN